MTGFDDFTMSLLTNELILNMHRNARHSHQVWRKNINDTEHILWTAVNAEGGQYVAIFNVGDANSNITITLDELEIYQEVSGIELWSKEKMKIKEAFTVTLNKHSAKAYLLSTTDSAIK